MNNTEEVPTTPTAAMLRPFMGCPDDELELAWSAMLYVVRVDRQRETERRRLEMLNAPGRRTDGEYRGMGSPSGWLWLEDVGMWERCNSIPPK